MRNARACRASINAVNRSLAFTEKRVRGRRNSPFETAEGRCGRTVYTAMRCTFFVQRVAINIVQRVVDVNQSHGVFYYALK